MSVLGPTSAAAEATPPALRVKLLLVDDREADLEVLRLTLADPAYEVVAVRSGAEALKLVLREDFAVILLDVMMPIMDGFEIASLIKRRERSATTPILFLSAGGEDMSFIYRAYSVGAVDFLAKPIDVNVVRAKVAVFAELYRKDVRIRLQAEALREAERRREQLELLEVQRTSERRYHNLADAIPAIVWTARPDGAVDHANRRWLEYTGLGDQGTHEWAWLGAVHPDDVVAFEAGWRTALVTQVEYVAECRLRRGTDGVYRAHLCHSLPERDTTGEVVGWLGTAVDCQDLRQAIQARDEFLSIASHELRTPVATLDLCLHSMGLLLAELPDPQLSALLQHRLELGERQTRRLNTLVGALLDLTRIDGARALVDPEPCDAALIVREVVERHQDEAARAACPITVSGDIAALGVWDPLRLDQGITNLVSNALRYAAGKPIEIAVRHDDAHVMISVRDHGEGIAPEHLGLLFGRFQGAGSNASQSGLGLGLFISRRLMRAHGGDITVASAPGEGALFTIELPLGIPAATPAAVAANR